MAHLTHAFPAREHGRADTLFGLAAGLCNAADRGPATSGQVGFARGYPVIPSAGRALDDLDGASCGVRLELRLGSPTRVRRDRLQAAWLRRCGGLGRPSQLRFELSYFPFCVGGRRRGGSPDCLRIEGRDAKRSPEPRHSEPPLLFRQRDARIAVPGSGWLFHGDMQLHRFRDLQSPGQWPYYSRT
jgi:hypothetical protein